VDKFRIDDLRYKVHCPLHHCEERVVWCRTVIKNGEIHLPDCNGCDDECGAVECKLCVSFCVEYVLKEKPCAGSLIPVPFNNLRGGE
jgi:hypothetical protein